jgi:hypothetical protein
MVAALLAVAVSAAAPAAAALPALAPATVGLSADGGMPSPPPDSNPAPTVALGSVGVRLLDVPIDAANDPRARQYIVDHLVPGTTIHRRIEISNSTAGPLRVAMYPDAAEIANGSFIGAAGDKADDLSSWTTLSQSSLDIPTEDVACDTVTIAVPADAAPGERYAVVWAQVSGRGGGGVSLVNRVGIRMYVSIGGANPPASGFTVDTMTAQRNPTGMPIVQALVHNTGGRALDMSGTLKLTGVSGALTAGPYAAQLGTTLAPGQSEPVKVVLTDQVSDGPWNATIELKSGLVDETYQSRISFPRDRGAALASAAYPKSAGAGPTTAQVALLITVAAAAGVFLITRRRRARQL